MKGVIAPDHVPVNNYQMIVNGLPPLVFTEVSGIEDELEKVDLPDRTTASGGNRKSTEVTVKLPAHHVVMRQAMENWYKEGQDPVSPTYKKNATYILTSLSRLQAISYRLTGVWVSGRTLPDGEMENEGEMAVIEYTLTVDDIDPS
jgi:hypothetical protein